MKDISQESNIVRLSRFLICLFFINAGLQYMIPHIVALAKGDVSSFRLSADYLNVGGARYIKDLYSAFFGVAWIFLIFRIKHNKTLLKSLIIYLVFESFLMILGLLGHLDDPIPLILIGGVRWILLLHNVVGIFFLCWAYKIKQESFNWIVFLILLANVGFSIIQRVFCALILGMKEVRAPGLFANAEAYSFALVGISLFYFFQAQKISRIKYFLLFSLIMIGVICSGARSAMLIIFTLFAATPLLSLYHSTVNIHLKALLNSIFVVFPLLLVTILIPLVEMLANRGNILHTQIQSGRIHILFKTLDLFNTTSLFHFLFGKGFGYGTNSVLLFGATSPWLYVADSTIVTTLLQFGFLGSTYFISAMSVLFLVVMFHPKFKKKVFEFYFLFIALALLICTQNIFENFILLPLLAVSFSNLLLASENSLHETTQNHQIS